LGATGLVETWETRLSMTLMLSSLSVPG
jgi:hypothetical protein